MAAPRFNRYERVYDVSRNAYGHLVAPGCNGDTVTVSFGNAPHVQVPRNLLRRLTWWERLLDR